jgi:signal transduction histidine kinase
VFLAALNDVSSALLDDGSVDDTLRLVTNRARVLLDADLAMLVLPAPETGDADQLEDVLVVQVADGLAARALEGSSLPTHHSMAGFTMREREPVLIADGSKDPRLFRPPAWPSDLGATLIVPLHARGVTVGVLTIARRRGRPMFLASDISFMTSFAEKATLAITFAKTQELAERAHGLSVVAARTAEELEDQRVLVDRLEELDRIRSDFVSSISHELRTPLTSVIGYVEMLIDANSPDATDEGRMLAIVERNSRRLLSLIEDLLAISQIEEDAFTVVSSPVDIPTIVEHVRETMAVPFATAGLALVVNVEQNLHLDGDQEQLERAVLNLVSNALKFSDPGGLVEIAFRRSLDNVEVTVRDTGCGISAGEQEQLFTRFFRGARSRELEIQGTGLGLFIVKQIVDRHGGRIEVTSTPLGSMFTMRLPIDRPAVSRRLVKT